MDAPSCKTYCREQILSNRPFVVTAEWAIRHRCVFPQPRYDMFLLLRCEWHTVYPPFPCASAGGQYNLNPPRSKAPLAREVAASPRPSRTPTARSESPKSGEPPKGENMHCDCISPSLREQPFAYFSSTPSPQRAGRPPSPPVRRHVEGSLHDDSGLDLAANLDPDLGAHSAVLGRHVGHAQELFRGGRVHP